MALDHGINTDTIWYGRHSTDGDTLVFDPVRATPGSSNISFFSLTQLRPRAFPRAAVERFIHEIVDPKQRALAEKRYRDLPSLEAEHERDLARAASDTAARQRARVIETHKLFLVSQNLPYVGVRDSSEGHKGAPPRWHRTACQACRIPLDDFAQLRCEGCGGVLCSCGACGCRAAPVAS